MMKKYNILKKTGTIVLAFFLFIPFAFPQDTQGAIESLLPAEEILDEEARLQIAISGESYPVTPGDVYNLTFHKVGELVSGNILVETDYTINLSDFGKINALAKTFPEIKNIVETKIIKAYPQSMPLFTITSLGIFQVPVKGEVLQSRQILCWGLSRLSNVIRNVLTPVSSLREIGVQSRSGELMKYDLFRARLLGEMDNDPVIKPGDTIIVYKSPKEVEIKGEINRTGKYQIKDNETFQYLIKTYARDFTQKADLTRIKIERIFKQNIRTLYFNLDNEKEEIKLEDGDIITIPSKMEYKPVIFVEGAISAPDSAALEAINEGEYNHLTFPFLPGETVYDICKKIENLILAASDLKNSYLMRTVNNQVTTIPLDIEQLLYNYANQTDILLSPFDKIVVPARQMNISVQGDVRAPGIYPSLPGKNFLYYLNMAGGPIHGTYVDNIINITAANGAGKTTEDLIENGDKIEVRQAYINVFGAVATPGQYPFFYGKPASYYLLLAGGTLSGSYNSDAVDITGRNGEAKSADDPIAFGDTIIVMQAYIIVFGAVATPGQYPLSYGKPVAYYLSLAGGTLSGSYGSNTVTVTARNGESKSIDSIIELGDTIIVTQHLVAVSGAVGIPNRYPYADGKTYSYYINLAGGIDAEHNMNGEVIIYDARGKMKSKSDLIEPDDRIYVPYNTFMYNFNKYLPLVTTTIAIINVTLAIMVFARGQ